MKTSGFGSAKSTSHCNWSLSAWLPNSWWNQDHYNNNCCELHERYCCSLKENLATEPAHAACRVGWVKVERLQTPWQRFYNKVSIRCVKVSAGFQRVFESFWRVTKGVGKFPMSFPKFFESFREFSELSLKVSEGFQNISGCFCGVSKGF